MSQSKVYQEKLSNGLDIIAESIPHAKSTSLGFFVRTGARDETKQESGISHFLEHMMFKGTATLSSIDLTFALGNIGAQANAYTSEENTVYYATVVPEYVGRMTELLSDMLRPSLDPNEFNVEKKVIQEEIALYQDRPNFYLYEKALELFYSGHSAGNSVLGTTESVGAISVEQMRDYFNRRYQPSNMTFVATGNLDWPKLRSDLARLTQNWLPGDAKREIKPFKASVMKHQLSKKDIQQAHYLMLSSSVSAQDEERFELAVLSMILGDGVGSRIYWELVHPGIVEGAGCDLDEKDGTGCMMVSSSMEPARLSEAVEILHRIIAKPLDFSDEELERAKTKLCARIVLGGELPMGRFGALGNEWVYRKKIHSLAQTIDRVRAVTRSTIGAALERFPMKDWSEFSLLPA